MIIHCRECGTEISSLANACPKCGALSEKELKMQEDRKKQKDLIMNWVYKGMISIGWLLFLLSFIVYVSDKNDHRYTYTTPFDDHEIAIIFKFVLGLILICLFEGKVIIEWFKDKVNK